MLIAVALALAASLADEAAAEAAAAEFIDCGVFRRLVWKNNLGVTGEELVTPSSFSSFCSSSLLAAEAAFERRPFFFSVAASWSLFTAPMSLFRLRPRVDFVAADVDSSSSDFFSVAVAAAVSTLPSSELSTIAALLLFLLFRPRFVVGFALVVADVVVVSVVVGVS